MTSSPLPRLTPATGDQDPGTQPDPADAAARLMIPVAQLAAHPGNVRADLDLTPEFCASVAEAGVRVSLLITKTTDGGYRVIEGHRRLAAALKAGLAEVPCDLDPARADDEAGQYLDMLLANGDGLPPELHPDRGSRRAVRRPRSGRHQDPAAQVHRPQGRGDQEGPAGRRPLRGDPRRGRAAGQPAHPRPARPAGRVRGRPGRPAAGDDRDPARVRRRVRGPADPPGPRRSRRARAAPRRARKPPASRSPTACPTAPPS